MAVDAVNPFQESLDSDVGRIDLVVYDSQGLRHEKREDVVSLV